MPIIQLDKAFRVRNSKAQVLGFITDVDANSKKIINLDAPTNPTDAVPKSYTDALLPPQGHIYGMKLSPNSTNPKYQVDIGVGICKNDDNDGVIEVSVPIMVDITVSGVNGLDTGTEASSTWYYVWVIKNPTTGDVAGLFSTSPTSPTMPSGYTKKRRIGVVRNHSNGDFLQFRQSGKGNDRTYLYFEHYNKMNVLSGGTANLLSPGTVDCSAFIPPTSTLGYFSVSNSTAGEYIIPSPGDYPMALLSYWWITAEQRKLIWMDTDSSQNILYAVSNPSGYIDVKGFMEEI